MSGQHTPGPWAVDGNLIKWTDPDDGAVYMAAMAWDAAGGSASANARLIAAAPKMLETLQAIASPLLRNVPSDVREAAREAVLLATEGGAS